MRFAVSVRCVTARIGHLRRIVDRVVDVARGQREAARVDDLGQRLVAAPRARAPDAVGIVLVSVLPSFVRTRCGREGQRALYRDLRCVDVTLPFAS